MFGIRRFQRLCFKQSPMLRTSIIVLLSLSLGAGPAGAQIFGQPFGQPQPLQAPRAQPPFQTQPQFRPFAPQSPPQLKPRPVQPSQPGQPQAQPASPPQNTPAPYDRDLQRLAEILGSLHFLRGICGANEGQKWRNEAQALIDTEASAGERRDLMIASFNRGYRAFQQSYRTCTPAADFAIRRYLAEGAKIAREITARYAN
jgi:uncharacterized protein (TIGR02301 family)